MPPAVNSRGAVGSTKGPDIAYQVVDLGARQRKVRHRSVRVCKESTQLVRTHPAARDCCKAGRTLRNSAGWIRVNHVAIGAPLASDLCALGNVGKGRSYPNQRKNQPGKYNSRKSVRHFVLLAVIVVSPQ